MDDVVMCLVQCHIKSDLVHVAMLWIPVIDVVIKNKMNGVILYVQSTGKLENIIFKRKQIFL